MHAGTGLFVSMEGSDSSGKSTQIKLLRKYLELRGLDVTVVREPGGTAIGERIRAILLDNAHPEMDYLTEAMLYAASRAQMVSQIILPALDAGKTVLCDRFVDSSIAYQGGGRRLGDVVDMINAYAVRGCIPDVTFLLKIRPDIAEIRRNTRENDRIESETLAYHERVYETFLTLEKKHSDRIVGVDGTLSADEISAEIIKRVDALLRSKNAGL
ncbi:MAG: dTMP kinase [Clostridiales Family XIII bacterium]|jgi:dTMP kinase|nr:dTMP kinase [Clostridiales Family XIII bacterium]